ncbi:MAG: sugar phosphate isomerase/epimerase family protein [Candidatus Acidiferrales bacterium]
MQFYFPGGRKFVLRVLSTYRYVDEALSFDVLAAIARAGISRIEIFCVQRHWNYRNPETVRTLADWLEENRLTLQSLHSPTERDLAPGRESGVPLAISEPERVRRIDAVDEIKRVLEVAEHIPFRFLIQHMGHGRLAADQRRRDAAFSSLEHLSIFARERGVTIALENTPGEFTSPASLVHFLEETHLRDVKLCFDAGHAHMEDGVAAGFEVMRSRIVSAHLHDNHGLRDEHLLPFEGDIDWQNFLPELAALGGEFPAMLELKRQASGAPSLEQIFAAFGRVEEHFVPKGATAAGD